MINSIREKRILQVFNNLVSNAIKFTEPGGEIAIIAEPLSDKRRVQFGVKDNGVGIQEEDLNKIFKVESKFTLPGTEGEKGAAVTYAPEAVKRGAVVIDNGADFRLKNDVPLVVPEVNPQDAKRHKGIIANPNCSTIQFVVAIGPIHKEVGIKRAVVSSYQAVSGAGRGGVKQLESEYLGQESAVKAFAHQISKNVIPHIGGFGGHAGHVA